MTVYVNEDGLITYLIRKDLFSSQEVAQLIGATPEDLDDAVLIRLKDMWPGLGPPPKNPTVNYWGRG